MTRADLIGPVWEPLVEAFAAGDSFERVAVLKALAKPAIYQPSRTIELADHAFHPLTSGVETEPGRDARYAYTERDVQQALVPLLRSAAYHAEHLPRATEMVWRIALAEPSLPYGRPGAALQALNEIAAHSRHSPRTDQQALAAQVQRWLDRETYRGSTRSPLALLRPIMAIIAEERSWTGPDTLALQSFIIQPTAQILALRDFVIKLAFDELTASDLVRVEAGVQILHAAMHPDPPRSMAAEETVERLWYPQYLGTLRRLAEWARHEAPAPALSRWCIRQHLHWLANYGPDELRQAARDVIFTLPTSVNHELRSGYCEAISSTRPTSTITPYVGKQSSCCGPKSPT